MEVKTNVRQRRMDRMKQLMEAADRAERERTGGHAAKTSPGAGRDRAAVPYDRREAGMGEERFTVPFGNRKAANGMFESVRRDPRMDDPEYVWKREERARWASWRNGESGNDGSYGGLTPPSSRQIGIKLGISAALFGLVLGMFRLEHPLAREGQHWVRAALTQDSDFTAVAAWYERTFGGLPAMLPAFGSRKENEAQNASSPSVRRLYAPVRGQIVSASGAADPGVILATKPDAPVAAMDAGRVVSVTSGTDKGTIVVIRHAGGLQTTYGWIQNVAPQKNDWVKGGETIGIVTTEGDATGKLYFAVQKDDRYVNPAEVVSFD